MISPVSAARCASAEASEKRRHNVLSRRVIRPGDALARRVAFERRRWRQGRPETDLHPLAHVVVSSANAARPENPADAYLLGLPCHAAPPPSSPKWLHASSPLQEPLPIRAPLPGVVHAPSTLHELCPMTTPSPVLSKLQNVFGTAVPPQDEWPIFGPAGGFAETPAPVSNNADTPRTHPNLRNAWFVFMCPPSKSQRPLPTLARSIRSDGRDRCAGAAHPHHRGAPCCARKYRLRCRTHHTRTRQSAVALAEEKHAVGARAHRRPRLPPARIGGITRACV